MVVETYDPLNAPDPDEWLDTDEGERISLVAAHHRKTGAKLPSMQAHAAIHAVVENQIALGDEVPTGATVERLMREGLDRHDAIHAVGSILAEHMNELLSMGEAGPDANERFYEKLRKLKAAEWLKSFR